MKRRGFLASIFAIPAAVAAAKEIKPEKVIETEKKLEEIRGLEKMYDPATGYDFTICVSVSMECAIPTSAVKLFYPK